MTCGCGFSGKSISRLIVVKMTYKIPNQIYNDLKIYKIGSPVVASGLAPISKITKT